MALHAELSLDIAVYGETTKETKKFNMKFDSKTLDNFVLESSARLKLAASATDTVYSFQSVTGGQLVLIQCEAECTVKINGIAETAYTLKPLTNTDTNVKTPAFLAMLADGITELHFSNPDSSNAIEIDVGVAGAA